MREAHTRDLQQAQQPACAIRRQEAEALLHGTQGPRPMPAMFRPINSKLGEDVSMIYHAIMMMIAALLFVQIAYGQTDYRAEIDKYITTPCLEALSGAVDPAYDRWIMAQKGEIIDDMEMDISPFFDTFGILKHERMDIYKIFLRICVKEVRATLGDELE